MYIKSDKNNGSRKTYSNLQLVEEVRKEKVPRKRLIIKLDDLNVKPEKNNELVTSIESMLTGQAVLLSMDTAIAVLCI